MKGENNMSFTIDENSLTIKGRKGDSASFTFEFENDLTGFNLDFEIKKNLNGSDAIITKTFSNIQNNAIEIILSAEDTSKFPTVMGNYLSYHWGLKIYDDMGFAQTLIPDDLNTPPLFLIYPEVVGE